MPDRFLTTKIWVLCVEFEYKYFHVFIVASCWHRFGNVTVMQGEDHSVLLKLTYIYPQSLEDFTHDFDFARQFTVSQSREGFV